MGHEIPDTRKRLSPGPLQGLVQPWRQLSADQALPCGALALVGERLLSDGQIALVSCFVETPQVLMRDGK
jgi:hypothetical protein